MSVIFFLIPLSIILAACFFGAFIWAVRSGQYEDTCTPSMRVLLDEPSAVTTSPSPLNGERAGVRGGKVAARRENESSEPNHPSPSIPLHELCCSAGVPPAGSASVPLVAGSGGGTPPKPAAEDGCATPVAAAKISESTNS